MTANPADEPRVDDDPEGGTKPSASAWSAWSHDELLVIVERQAAEVERLTKLAEANGRNARFWGDHFAEIEAANRDALGEHHRPGHTVAELITKLVRRYDIANESREKAWAQLAEVGKLLGAEDYDVGEVPDLVERYVDQVKLVTERLTRERDEAKAKLEQSHEINQGWVRYGERVKGQKREWRQKVTELEARLASRPAIPADAREAAIRVVAENQLRRYDDEFDASHLSWVDFEGSATADINALTAAGLLAPVSGSDTTAEA